MRSKFAPVLWVVLLAGVPATLFTWYFLAQRQHILSLDQRELGRAADNLWQILRISASTVANLGGQPSYTCAFDRKQSYLKLFGTDCQEFGTTPDLPRDSTDVKARKAEVWYNTDGAGLVLATHTAPNGKPLSFTVLLEKALDELLVSDDFETLFVTDEDGRVLFQSVRGERKRWLDQLHWLERKARDDGPAPSGSLRLRSLDELRLPDGSKVKFADLSKTTNSVQVEIAQKLRRVHLQPIGDLAQLDSRKSGHLNKEGTKTPVIFLGGIVDSSASAAQALAIEPLYALALALFVVFGLLTSPVIKFAILAPRERFRFQDFYLLSLSTAASAGLAIVVVFAVDNYMALRSYSDGRLATLSDSIARGFTDEVANMATQLWTYDQEMRTKLAKDPKCEKTVDVTHLFTPGDKEPRAPRPTAYGDFVSVFWVRHDGEQFAKMTPLASNTPLVNVVERPYFRAALDGRLWSFAPGSGRSYKGPPFFVQVYRSITTGAFETGLSMRSDVPGCERTDDAPNVAVLTTGLKSLGPHALPPDLGFMIIDRSGRVLYHSDPRRALREELFEEVGNPQQLRSIVLGGQPRIITASYRSVPHRFHIRPIHDLVDQDGQPVSWYIVAFRDLELARTAASEAVLLAMAWATICFGLLGFVPAAVLMFLGPKRASWVWPRFAETGAYGRLARALAVLCGAAVIATIVAHGWALIVVAAATSAAGGGLVLWQYRRVRDSDSASGQESPRVRSWPRSPQQLRTAVATLLLAAASIIPAATLFKFAWNERIGALVSYDGQEIARSTIDLKESTYERLRREFSAKEAYGDSWRTTVSPFLHDLDGFQWAPIPPAPDATDAHGAPDPIARLLPVYSDSSAALRFQATDDRLAAKAGLAMRFGPVSILSGCVLMGVLIFWIRYGDTRLLLSTLADTRADEVDVSAAIRNARDAGQNLIVVIDAADAGVAMRAVSETAARSAAAGAGGSDTSVPALAGAQPPFDLTDALCDTDTRLATLAALEQSAETGGAIVFSPVDPVPMLLGPGDDASSIPAIDAAERRRWSALMNRFSVLRVPADGRATQAAERCGSTRECEAYYWAIWNGCTDQEKLTLVHIVEEGFANPRDMGVVTRLLRRGLLVLAPDLSPLSNGFRDFIKRTYDRNLVARLERPAGRIGWVQARRIIIFVLFTLALFLVGTQRQALAPMIAFVTALAGALGAVLKLISEFGPKRSA